MKMFDVDETRMIGLPYGEKNYNNTLSRFHLIPERHGQTNGQTDGQTDWLRGQLRADARKKCKSRGVSSSGESIISKNM